MGKRVLLVTTVSKVCIGVWYTKLYMNTSVLDELRPVQDHFCGIYEKTRCADSQHDWPMCRPKQYVSLALIHYKGEPTRRELIAVNKANRAGKNRPNL